MFRQDVVQQTRINTATFLERFWLDIFNKVLKHYYVLTRCIVYFYKHRFRILQVYL